VTAQPLVGSLHHAALAVHSLDEAFGRWTRLMGLHGERVEEGLAVLRCAHDDYSIVLRQTTGASSLDHVCYELAPGVTLSEARRTLDARGAAAVACEVPIRGQALALRDPDGNRVVLVPRVTPADRRPAESKRSTRLPGWHPRKLGHINFLTADLQRQCRWYTDALGFRVTDWLGAEGVWLHVNADHHALAFIEKGYAHVHHLAFELVDWGEMRVALDHLAQNDRRIVWGPGRHGVARNLFSYFRMIEEELFIELFCDLEQLAPDHEPRRFPDDPVSSNTWGILPPRTYFRFDRAAVEAELEQSYAYGKPIPAVP
jgi:catechol 2,3-dioxygenase-like lactoylglutathione lyase family enzyme